MEKRTILAFVLSFLILLGWSYFFAPKQEEAPPQEATTPQKKERPLTEPVKSPDLSVAKTIPEDHPERSIVPKTEEKEIQVETPFYRAVFSNVNATIKSIKLKKYRLTTDPHSPLIELVHTGEKKRRFF